MNCLTVQEPLGRRRIHAKVIVAVNVSRINEQVPVLKLADIAAEWTASVSISLPVNPLPHKHLRAATSRGSILIALSCIADRRIRALPFDQILRVRATAMIIQISAVFALHEHVVAASNVELRGKCTRQGKQDRAENSKHRQRQESQRIPPHPPAPCPRRAKQLIRPIRRRRGVPQDRLQLVVKRVLWRVARERPMHAITCDPPYTATRECDEDS